ncbi:MAG: methylglyoxal synthase [Chloroflexota bacterium]
MKTLALIAHDGKKADMVAWATFNRNTLARYRLIGTQGTAKLLRDKVGLEIEAVQSGAYGGRVVEGQVDAVIFLVDPMDKHPHEPDIQALLRLCVVHNVPLATNVATADAIIATIISAEATKEHPGTTP